jgi:hypothetical protein
VNINQGEDRTFINAFAAVQDIKLTSLKHVTMQSEFMIKLTYIKKKSFHEVIDTAMVQNTPNEKASSLFHIPSFQTSLMKTSRRYSNAFLSVPVPDDVLLRFCWCQR